MDVLSRYERKMNNLGRGNIVRDSKLIKPRGEYDVLIVECLCREAHRYIGCRRCFGRGSFATRRLEGGHGHGNDAQPLRPRIGAAIPSMAGHLGFDWLLPAFLAPVLGGTLLSGGKVTVFGTMLGAILVTLINNGLYLIDVGEFWVRFFLGIILLGAVLLDRAREYFTVKNSIVS